MVRVHTLLNEIFACKRLSGDCRSFVRLLWETAWFHLENKLGRHIWPGGSKPFAVNIRLNCITTTIWLRRWAGDIFVFYEVLAGHAYRVTPAQFGISEMREIIDCGGNIGLSALYFADQYPNARIVSVEPMPENFDLLCRNTSNVPRITPLNGCISNSEGTRRMSTDRPAWGNRVASDGMGVSVPAFTIAGIIRRHRIARIDLLKIDIEGEESKIMPRADFLKNTRLLLIELHAPYSFREFAEHVCEHGMTALTPATCPEIPCTAAWHASAAAGPEKVGL
jgi:FkbM family methyltransferase